MVCGKGGAAEADLGLFNAGISRAVAGRADGQVARQIRSAFTLNIGFRGGGGERLRHVHVHVGQAHRRAGGTAGRCGVGMIGGTDADVVCLQVCRRIAAAVHIGTVGTLCPGVDIVHVGVHRSDAHRRCAHEGSRVRSRVGIHCQVAAEFRAQVAHIGADR